MSSNKFTNPWPTARKDDPNCKVTAYVPDRVLNELKSKRLRSGTQSTTINLLIEKLLYECQRRGIHDFHTAERFEQFVIHAKLALPEELNGRYGTDPIHGDESVQAPIPNGGSVASPLGGPTPPPDSHTIQRNDGGTGQVEHSQVGSAPPCSADAPSRSTGRSGRGRGKASKDLGTG